MCRKLEEGGGAAEEKLLRKEVAENGGERELRKESW